MKADDEPAVGSKEPVPDRRAVLGFVGPESFYGFLAQHGRELFRDEDFLELYCPDTGRPSLPPSLLGLALLLQAHDRVWDAEATQRG